MGLPVEAGPGGSGPASQASVGLVLAMCAKEMRSQQGTGCPVPGVRPGWGVCGGCRLLLRVEQEAWGWGDGEGWGQERTLGTPAVSAPTVGPMRGERQGEGVGLRPEGPLALAVEKLQCPGPEPGHIWSWREAHLVMAGGWLGGSGAGQGQPSV